MGTSFAMIVGIAVAISFAVGFLGGAATRRLRARPRTRQRLLRGDGDPGVVILPAAIRTTDTPEWNELAILGSLAAQLSASLSTGQLANGLHALVAETVHLSGQAYRDPLTGLGNRAALNTRLEQALATAAASGDRQCAVVYLDLDGFKPINDALGHHAGDLVLARAAARFQRCIRSVDLACRVGGDEFALVLDGIDEAEAIAIGRRALAAVCLPFHVDETEVVVSASIGIALSGDDATLSAEELLARADAAMYDAKRGGKGAWALYGRARETGAPATDTGRLSARP